MKQFLTFHLGKESYALNLVQTKEIIKNKKITNVPNTEKDISGVINLRGQIVPVLDLKKSLGLKPEDAHTNINEEEKRIIIVELNNLLTGILVDSVRGVVEVDEEEIEKVSVEDKSIKKEYIDGVIKMDRQLLIIIDLNKTVFRGEVE